jgi:signal transduction histidine kinase
VHDPLVQLEPGLVEELGDSLRLAVEHERLQATVSAQLQELRASRAHIVAVGDAERRQLERDLHDGAQQRLLSLGLALQLADAGGGAGPEAKPFIVQAQLELQAAHTELRELGHGIHPAVLTDDGLAPALATLAERAPVPLVVRGVPPDRLPEPIELTAYLLAAEAVTDAADRPGSVVAVGIGQDGNRVTVDVESDGIDGVVAGRPGLEAIADRVAALDGSLHVWTSADGHGHMRAELPDTRSAP